ncbi:MAG TPA: universal stress protein, partial [Vicinamibacteria bacterium]|nr:universal stress protein [Vicinamibacteria bacterium]
EAAIASMRTDLVVLATLGREGVGNLFADSVAERLLRHPPCAVLCVGNHGEGSAAPYRRLLAPVDLGPEAHASLPFAGTLARAFAADVVALHVTWMPGLRTLAGVPEMVETFVPTEEQVEDFVRPAFDGVRVIARVDMGHPTRRIVAAARAERTDLIVIGTHGHDSLADAVVGTRAEWIVRHAPCPVVVVPST